MQAKPLRPVLQGIAALASARMFKISHPSALGAQEIEKP